ncbi:hypothetical protein [Streptomyces palmae]|uniref:Uncharacterized protein n=1 Tax=Streptomyces palmae TaxID=1701085 RepID=A0A4Z0H790_9ACTN|nr:hypothetical protein [Streptomyces palmae]TGB05887.1 hypothetical protein E4099_18760 [Streptomyces palmae]
MAITDDVRKTLTDPTPLYFVAGTADLAAQKLREVPALVEKLRAEAPERLAAVRKTDPQAVQERVTQQAKEAQEKLTELLGSLDTDLKKLRDTAQELALQGVGRAAELAIRARDTYEEVAEHGREAVRTWRGEAADEVVEVAEKIEPPAEQPKKAPAQRAGAGTGTDAGAGRSTKTTGGAASTTRSANGSARTAKPAGGTRGEAAKPAAKPVAKSAPPRKAAAKKTAPKPAE